MAVAVAVAVAVAIAVTYYIHMIVDELREHGRVCLLVLRVHKRVVLVQRSKRLWCTHAHARACACACAESQRGR